LDTQKTGKGTRRMFHRIFATDDSVATTILRIVLGIVFFAHGTQKMLGWFGGPGFSTTMNAFTQVMHEDRMIAIRPALPTPQQRLPHLRIHRPKGGAGHVACW
jgi:uncharacterized membrane protein YphA (DoxX/SURF4 family)